jgi:hypothetical protein
MRPSTCIRSSRSSPRVKPYKARELADALREKGFHFERATDDKIYYLWDEADRKTRVWTKVSHGRGEELGFRLLKKIQRELFLDTSAQLQDFIDGSIDRPAYLTFLRQKGIIEAAPPDRR